MSDPRATLAQLVADTLREAIHNGQIACGERLIELAIAQSHNVSQNTVRDALRRLENEGWVRYEARHGVRVRSFDAGEAEEVFALMATVEQLAVGWVFDDHKRAQLLAALTPPVARARDEHNVGQIALRRKALFGFHAALLALTGRSQTQALLRTLHNQAYLLTTDFETHAESYTHHFEQLEGYEHLLGMLKFGSSAEIQSTLFARILADGRPIVRWLAMHT
ncbi:MAG: GntR family transcriptional regulator [Chloroflexi bacterium]|nr:GntR family transcriptional regulator [Chloroflexota bacterium]